MSNETPTKRRRQPAPSRDSSSTRARTRTRIDSWRGSLRSPSQQHATSCSNPVTKATPTTAASAVTASAASPTVNSATSPQASFQAVASVLSYVVALPELSLPSKLIRRKTSNPLNTEPEAPEPGACDGDRNVLETLKLVPVPEPEPTSTLKSISSTAPIISLSPPKSTSASNTTTTLTLNTTNPISDTSRPIAIPDPSSTHAPRARRRRRSSISRSSSRSSSPPIPTSRPLSPPLYSAPLPAPPAFESGGMHSHSGFEPSETIPPPMDASSLHVESLASPPAFLSTSFPPPPDQDGDGPVSPSPSRRHPSPPTQREGSQNGKEQAPWWNYVPWSSSTPTATKAENYSSAGAPSDTTTSNTPLPLPSPTSPTSPPPLVPFPVTDPQTTIAAATVGLSLLNNVRTADGPELRDASSKPDAPDTLDSNRTTTTTDKPSGDGGWYAYWSWGTSGPGSTSAAGSAAGPSGPLTGLAPDGGGEAPTASDPAASGNERGEENRVDGEPDSDSVAVPAVDAQPPSNPLETSFRRDTLNWASFLSSTRRMLSVKRVTDGATDKGVERDENGVEVMEIDFEEEGADDSKLEGGGKVALPWTNDDEGQRLKEKEKKGNDDGKSDNPNAKTGSPSPASGSSGSAGLASRIWSSTTTTTTTTTATNVTSPSSRSQTPSRTPSRAALDSQAPQAPSRAPTPLQRHPSPAPSKRSMSSKSKPSNMVLPKWEETFFSPPRSVVSASYLGRVYMGEGGERERVMLGRGAGGEEGIGGKFLGRTVKFVSGLLGAGAGAEGKGREDVGMNSTEREMESRLGGFGQDLPKAWKVLEGVSGVGQDALRGCKKVVVIGVHGWFPGGIVRTVLGEPTGTSTKFASMMGSALEEFEREYGVEFEKVTLVPLEGEGTIEKRVDKLYANLLSNPEWTKDLHECDALFFVAHSQGCVVSTHLLDRLLVDGRVVTRTHHTNPYSHPGRKPQRICILALCGIHLGPLKYLRSSALVGPYLYFESLPARELFEFQNTESQVSKNYVRALGNVLDHGTKVVYIASLNDQVVPMYSGLFTAASHPSILRALYIDGDAYSSSDFLSNLLTLLIRILNSGLSDSGLLAHLSEATAGSLNGVGHSTVYEEMDNYTLAVKYLFLANEGNAGADSPTSGAKLRVEPFNALLEQNDYEIPWSLRDLIAHPLTSFLFSSEIEALRDGFRAWHPKTTTLRELRRKVAPLGRGSAVGGSSSIGGGGPIATGVVSKL